MAGRKKDAEKLVTVQAAVPVVIWRANRPLNELQHEELARKLQAEEERSGLKVMLLPNSVDLVIGSSLEAHTATQQPEGAQLVDGAKDETGQSSSTNPEDGSTKDETGQTPEQKE